MPLYEYCCQCCGERFERLVRAAAARDGSDGRGGRDGEQRGGQEIACPRCQAPQVERLFSAFARGASAWGAPQCDPLPSGAG